eukprot:TRINITY_DN623_c1_g1_i1.p1 TRINITY_DN623_c1_g1~~TRINITY_DN623_c1_g1_i1.p1  ORF type:complete len:377 (+),score=75.54 TRINITY_DN623_c1_g1_i1:60-1133(+)
MSILIMLRCLLTGAEKTMAIPIGENLRVGDLQNKVGGDALLMEGVELDREMLLSDVGIVNEDVIEVRHREDPHVEHTSTGYPANDESMQRAVEECDLETIKLLLKCNITLQSKHIHFACKENMEDLLYLILEKSACLNMRNPEGETPLITASKHGNLKCMQLILSKDPIDTVKCNEGKTFLHYAWKWNTINPIAFNKSLLRAQDNEGKTPLSYAIIHKKSQLRYLLYNDGYHLIGADHDGNTAMHLACLHDHVAAVRLFMSLYPYPVIASQNHDLNTSLHLAVLHGRKECVKALVLGSTVRPSLTEKNRDGLTPLDLPASEEIEQLLTDFKNKYHGRHVKEDDREVQKKAECGCILM